MGKCLTERLYLTVAAKSVMGRTAGWMCAIALPLSTLSILSLPASAQSPAAESALPVAPHSATTVLPAPSAPSAPQSSATPSAPTAPAASPPAAVPRVYRPTPNPDSSPSANPPASPEAGSATNPLADNAVTVISGPDFDISILPNGYYRVVSAPFPEGDITDDMLRAQGVSVFRFRKFGSGITGVYGDLASGAVACVSGTLDDGEVVGTAYTHTSPTVGEAGLQLGEQAVLMLGTEGARGRYSDSSLDLSGFSLINVGPVPPPESCV